MVKLIDLTESNIKSVLKTLLKDRSTGQNIIFATDAYDNIEFTTPLTAKLLLDDSVDIRPRVSKSMEEQNIRTRKKAEVFTPSWICNKMNNHCDTEWFDCANVFNTENGQHWTPTEGRIEFTGTRSWKDYVDSKRLEITCGEAPYLVSRYDAATGEVIPIQKRIGILDRKLRVVNENTQTRKTWHQWVYRAFESVYGYEYQGDNLLIARINLLETFCEYLRDRWGVEPTYSELKRVARIISWNIWQMDGIHGVVPFTGEYEPVHQIGLFEVDNIGNKEEKKYIDCTIYDWREDKEITYKSMRKG